jgi:hypothetical protein
MKSMNYYILILLLIKHPRSFTHICAYVCKPARKYKDSGREGGVVFYLITLSIAEIMNSVLARGMSAPRSG